MSDGLVLTGVVKTFHQAGRDLATRCPLDPQDAPVITSLIEGLGGESLLETPLPQALAARMSEDLRRHDARCDHALAFQHAADDGIAVDGQCNGLSHAMILERVLGERLAGLVSHERRHIAALVHLPENCAPRHLLFEVEPRVLLDAWHVCSRHGLDDYTSLKYIAQRL